MASFYFRFRSLWEQHGWSKDTPADDQPIYSLACAVLSRDEMVVYWEDIVQGNDLPWQVPVINLTALFTNPMKFRVAIVGKIHPMETRDLWDEQMLLLDYACCTARWSTPLYVASSAMSDWAGYERQVNSVEGANSSLFSGEETVYITNMPQACSNVSAGAIYGAIGSPAAAGTIPGGLLDVNFHFQLDWRKSGTQTWGLGTADGLDYASSTSTDILNVSSAMVPTASVGWKVAWQDGSQRSWAELKLKGSLLGSGRRFVAMGTEFQLPQVYGRAWDSLTARIEMDMDIIDGLIRSNEHYWISVYAQDRAGAHLVYNQTDATLGEGHHVILANLTGIMTNWTSATYLIVSLGASNMYGRKTIIAAVESMELIAMCTSSQPYVGVSSQSNTGDNFATPVSTSEWTWSSGSPLEAANMSLLVFHALDRITRGIEVDGGTSVRVVLAARGAGGGILATSTLYDGWFSSWFATSEASAAVPVGTLSLSFTVTMTLPFLSLGSGTSPNDLFTLRLTSIVLNGTGMSTIDLLASPGSWTFASRTASGIAELIGSGSSKAMRVLAEATAVPAAETKVFKAQLMSPVMYSDALRSKTYATLETWYTPVIDSAVPAHCLAGQSAAVTVSLQVYGRFYSVFYELGSYVIDEFTIHPDDPLLPRYAAIDISQFIGVRIPSAEAYASQIRVAMSVSIDVANATAGSWGIVAHDHMLCISTGG